jgi:threonine dehydrogenase-like Zn-dependent dehydrogenase
VTKELKIIGSYIFSLDDFVACARLLSVSAVDATPIITHRMD